MVLFAAPLSVSVKVTRQTLRQACTIGNLGTMVPFVWISILFFANLGKCVQHQIRHERTRYMTAGQHVFRSDSTSNAFSDPAGHHSLQRIRKPYRPLFSWDRPNGESALVGPVNYRNNNSAIKPTDWQGRRKVKPHLRKSWNRSGEKKAMVAFRNSYVYKGVPSEETRPMASKKIIRVISKNSRKERKKLGRMNGRKLGNGKKIGRRRKLCGNGMPCLGGRTQGVEDNEVARMDEFDHFPKGLMPDMSRRGMTASEMRRAEEENWRNVTEACARRSEKCDQICRDDNGRAVCACYAGYELIDGHKCLDVDECRTNNGGCDGTCINTIGSRRCLCPEGFRVSPVDGSCDDVNECLLRNGHGPCQDTCTNTRGSYYCSCEGLKGTVLSQDRHACEEVDDCRTGAAGCSHSCISTFGRAFCTCPDGFELGEDWKTCHDVDECSRTGEVELPCENGCVNTIGSYYCEEVAGNEVLSTMKM